MPSLFLDLWFCLFFFIGLVYHIPFYTRELVELRGFTFYCVVVVVVAETLSAKTMKSQQKLRNSKQTELILISAQPRLAPASPS
jgi:hypothetical protein